MTDPRPTALIAADPKGLIRESYAIEGITAAECRSILIDWALSLPLGADNRAAIAQLQAAYASDRAAHPMTQLLAAALGDTQAPKRRGGRLGRVAGET